MQPSFSRGSTEGAGIGGGINEESSQKELNSPNVREGREGGGSHGGRDGGDGGMEEGGRDGE